ncbi:MAG: hypothetical protein Q9217_000198 [Psora testacea]
MLLLHKCIPNAKVRKTTSKTFHQSSRDVATSSKPRINPRKRPLHELPSNTTEASDTPLLTQQHASGLRPSPKRPRRTEWPLKNDVEPESTSTKATKALAKSAPSQCGRQSKEPPRPSKFKEGSLNDKPSKEPPPAYVGQEEAMDDYVMCKDKRISAEEVYNAGTETTKPSSVFRLGKAIANALKPATVWQGINGIWKEKEQPVDVAQYVTQDRQDELFRVYEDMKATGFKDIKTTVAPASPQVRPSVLDKDQESSHSLFRDSAIDVEGEASSRHLSPDTSAGNCLKPPANHDSRFVSPLPGASSSRRSFTNLRTPSFQDVKRVKSHIEFPLTRLRSSAAPHLSTTESVDAKSMSTTNTGLRRQPSKKDIARVRKLNKRVSDLESKLETARQELKQSLREAPPIPGLPVTIDGKPFVPGNLPSLPSERLLSQHLRGAEDTSVVSGQANQSPNTMSDEHIIRPESDPQACQEQSRPYDDPVESITDTNERSEKNTTSTSRASRRKPYRERDIIAPSPAGIKKRTVPNVPSRIHRNSPMSAKEEIPPVPIPVAVFDPSKVDRARVLAKRSVHNAHVPFGKSPDDLINLRKEYPSATELQLVEYLVGQPTNDKDGVDYTSVQHANRPTSPFLGRPRAASPIKTRSRAQKRGISPPPPSLASAQKERDTIDVDGKLAHPVRGSSPILRRANEATAKTTLLKKGGKADDTMKVVEDKALPDTQKEEYEWDEDIF